MAERTARQATTDYPVDNNTYNLLQTLTSKLEALEAYRKYEQDADPKTKQLFEKFFRDDREHARELLETLKQTLK